MVSMPSMAIQDVEIFFFLGGSLRETSESGGIRVYRRLSQQQLDSLFVLPKTIFALPVLCYLLATSHVLSHRPNVKEKLCVLNHMLKIVCLMAVVYIEAIYNEDVKAVVGQKVMLPCNSSSNSSVRWLYRQTKLSNSQPIFTANGYERVVHVFQPSGRFAANCSSFDTFRPTLLIYEVQLADSGFYGCASNISYQITRLSVQRKYLDSKCDIFILHYVFKTFY